MSNEAASIIIATFALIILLLLWLMMKMRLRIYDLRSRLVLSDESVTAALEGNRPRDYADELIRVKPKPKPWEDWETLDEPNTVT